MQGVFVQCLHAFIALPAVSRMIFMSDIRFNSPWLAPYQYNPNNIRFYSFFIWNEPLLIFSTRSSSKAVERKITPKQLFFPPSDAVAFRRACVLQPLPYPG